MLFVGNYCRNYIKLFVTSEAVSLFCDFINGPIIVHPSSPGSDKSKVSKKRRSIDIDWAFSTNIVAADLEN